MRLLCVIPQMGAGGAERVMAALVNELSTRHTVSLLTWESPGTPPFFPLAASVQVVQPGLFGGHGLERVRRLAARFMVLRRHVRSWRPDVVLSFLDTTNVTTLVACLGTGVPVVVSERVDPAGQVVGRMFGLARRFTYPWAARTVVQTTRVARYFPLRMQSRIAVLPNPIAVALRTATPDEPGPDGRYRVIAVGRLEWQKGFDRLIAAFAQVASRHPLWDLHLFGEGSLRAALAAQAAAAGLGTRVRFPGVTSAIQDELAASHLLAFPSRYEGFPNALAEAMRVGLPTIGYDHVSGVEEMIVQDATGLLLPADGGVAPLAGALDELMADPTARRRLGTAAQQAGARWDTTVVLMEWESLLLRTAEPLAGPSSESGNSPSRLERER